MLINLRNALMSGRRLPYDAEVEYLQSTGTQWIDTGVSVDDNNYEIIADFQQIGQPSTAWVAAFTQYTAEAAESTRIINYDRRTNLIYVGYRRQANAQAAYNIDTTVRREYRLSLQRLRIYTNGVLTSDTTLSGPNGSPGQGATMKLARMSGRYYAFKVTHNGVLVRDFIPVRKGTVGYLYDRVSGKLFGNAGTGDFVLGQDVVPVEYIESTGTQYINTGLKYFPDFDVSIEVPSGQRNATIYCDATHTLERIGSSTPYWQIYAGDRLQSSVSVYGFHRVQFKASSLTIDGQAIGTISNRTWADGATCYIGFNGNNIYVYKLYGCQMWDINNNATRNYKPVRVGTGSTWEGALMDVLTRRIYRNAGTGAFGYGNDLKYPIPSE